MDALEHLEGDGRVARLEIERLSADQALRSDRLRDQRRHLGGEWRLIAVGDEPISQVEQPEGGEDRGRFAELEVIGFSAAAQRRIVHRREIVEDQRGRVHQFDRRRRRDRAIGIAAAQLRAQHDQRGPDLLGGRERGVGHGLLDAAAAAQQVLQLHRHLPLIVEKERRERAHFGAGPKVSMY
jgi:hypothetical protein